MFPTSKLCLGARQSKLVSLDAWFGLRNLISQMASPASHVHNTEGGVASPGAVDMLPYSFAPDLGEAQAADSCEMIECCSRVLGEKKKCICRLR